MDLGYKTIFHNITYQSQATNKTRQIDIEFYQGIFGKKKSIIECKHYEKSSLNLEEALKQLLSAKKFTRANEAYLVTNKNIRQDKDQIYKRFGIKIYDKYVLNHLHNIRNQNNQYKAYSLEESIRKTDVKNIPNKTTRYII